MIAGRKLGVLVVLSVCAAGLGAAWLVHRSLVAPPDFGPPAVAAKEEPPAAKPLPDFKVFKLPPRSAFKATLERPVFSRNRRPKEGAPVVVTQDLALKMQGVAGTGAEKRAMLVPTGGGERVRLREGEEYQGWTLSEIGERHVVFLRGDQKQRLDMNFREKPPPVRVRPGARQPAGAQGRQGQTAQQRKNQLQQQQRRLQQQRQQQQNRQQPNQQQRNQQLQNQSQQNAPQQQQQNQ